MEAALHGVDIDGGASGSGLDYDPTQGPGTPAWQQSLEMNARRRRN